jgi:anti-anti-sigma regulatory factor
MLKIDIARTPSEERWTLRGRLVGPEVEKLKASWKSGHTKARGRRCVVNLDEVTFIDKNGERVLRFMSRQGARFIATDVCVGQVLDRLKCKSCF